LKIGSGVNLPRLLGSALKRTKTMNAKDLQKAANEANKFRWTELGREQSILEAITVLLQHEADKQKEIEQKRK